MSKTMRRLTAILAAGAILFGTGMQPVWQEAMTLTAAAAEVFEEFHYEYYDGGIEITSYDGTATSVTIPDSIGDEPVTAIGYMAFSNCTGLESVSIPSSVKWIDERAFFDCTSLKEIELPTSMDRIGHSAFGNTPWLEEQLSENEFLVWDGILFDANTETCTGSITIPDTVTTIADGAFSECMQIKSVTIPGSVHSIGEQAFFCCFALEELSIAEGVTEIGSVAFGACDGMTTAYIPASVESLDTKAFFLCEKLAEISVSPDNKYYCAKNGAVLDKDEKRLLICPSGVTEFTVPESVDVIGMGAFTYNERLTNVTLPPTLKEIEALAFCSCPVLTGIVIPEGTEKIGMMAFEDCTSLQTITLPSSIAQIKNSAFSYCDALTDVFYNDVEDRWETVQVEANNDDLLNATFHFAAGTSSGTERELGDINGDGEINAEDAALLLAESARTGAGEAGLFNDKQNTAADINGDGEINAADAAAILAYAAAIGSGEGNVSIKDFI